MPDALADRFALDTDAAGTVHYATDSRIRRLAESMWRTRTGGDRRQWLALGKDSPDNMIREAREWVRAAVACGILRPPAEFYPADDCSDPWCARVDHAPHAADTWQ